MACTLGCLVSTFLLFDNSTGAALGEEKKGADLLAGGDLSKHFITTGNWILDKEGVVALKPRSGEKGWRRFDAYLWLKDEYQDFEIEFDYKIDKGGNSGLHFNVGDLKSPVQTGLEVQISDLPKKAKLGDHHPGGVIPGIPPTQHAGKPVGEWNHFLITHRGNDVTVVLNGATVNKFKLDHPRIKNRPSNGFIGFQDNARPLWLRNIRIKKL